MEDREKLRVKLILNSIINKCKIYINYINEDFSTQILKDLIIKDLIDTIGGINMEEDKWTLKNI